MIMEFPSSTDVTATDFIKQQREALNRNMTGLGEFIPLKDGSKQPNVKFSLKSTRMQEAPNSGNIGFVPGEQVLILDLDVSVGKVTPKEGLAKLSDELGLDLMQGFTVSTPSGGLHSYLRWPEAVPMPKNTKIVTDYMKADIRGGNGTNGYCVAPGSYFEGKPYVVLTDSPPIPISEEQAQAIVGMIPKHSKWDEARRRQPSRTSRGSFGNSSSKEDDSVENEWLIERNQLVTEHGSSNSGHFTKITAITGSLAAMKEASFVSRRARVYCLLSCCETDETILAYWRELGIDRDTSKNCARIQTRYLRHEFSRLRPSEDHNRLCRLSSSPAASRSKKTERGVYLGPRAVKVMSYRKFVAMMCSTRQKPGKYHALAFAIFEDFLQTWSNLGVKGILLNEPYLAKFYETDIETIHAAKRLLLRKGVLIVRKKPYKGKTTVFNVNPELIDESLTPVLQARTIQTSLALIVRSREQMIVSARTGEVVGDPFYYREINDLPEQLVLLENYAHLLPSQELSDDSLREEKSSSDVESMQTVDVSSVNTPPYNESSDNHTSDTPELDSAIESAYAGVLDELGSDESWCEGLSVIDFESDAWASARTPTSNGPIPTVFGGQTRFAVQEGDSVSPCEAPDFFPVDDTYAQQVSDSESKCDIVVESDKPTAAVTKFVQHLKPERNGTLNNYRAPIETMKLIAIVPPVALAVSTVCAASAFAATPLIEAGENPVSDEVGVYVVSDAQGQVVNMKHGSSVADALKATGVKLQDKDQVSAPLDSVVDDRQLLRVTRLSVKEVKTTESVAFATVKSKTAVPCGSGEKTKVTTKGVPGVKTITWNATHVDGVLTTERRAKEGISKPAVNAVVAPCIKIEVDNSVKQIENALKKTDIAAPSEATSLPSSVTEGGLVKPSDKVATKVSGTKQQLMAAAGIAPADWPHVDYIISRESEWKPTAKNPSSGAYGLPQSLPGTKMASAGSDWRTNPVTQLKWADSYVKERYNGWSGARKFWSQNRWY